MKYIILILGIFIFTSGSAQQIGSKVTLTAFDGKIYTGKITEIQGYKFKVKYDGYDFDARLIHN